MGQAGRVRGGQAAPAARFSAGEEVFEKVAADPAVVREQQLLCLQIRVAGVRGGEVGVLEQAAGGVKRGILAGLAPGLLQDRVHQIL